MYKIYALTDVKHIDYSNIEPLIHYLPVERQEKALSFRRNIDKKNCVISYLLLQYALYRNCGILSIALSYGRNKKPYLSNYSDIHFNISHCDSGCICAIADNPIGIDIQNIRPFSWSVANHCCSAAEKQLIKDSEDPAAAFTKIWTIKESYLKMKGTGIINDLCTVDTTILKSKIKTFRINDCYVSVASAESFREEERCLT